MTESIGFLSVEVFETIHFADVVQVGFQGLVLFVKLPSHWFPGLQTSSGSSVFHTQFYC